MSKTHQASSSRFLATSLSALGCAAVLVAAASTIATQSRIIPPQRSTNSNVSAKRQRIATLRASDSSEGSRVSLSADLPLNDYEAYRRGDRFYIKIPPVEVPRPEAVRGRGFADVKVQRGTDSTIISFRLQPGVTARVEQRGNKLEVVFTMPDARSSTSSANVREVARNDAGPAPPPTDSKRRTGGNSNTSSTASSPLRSGNQNSSARAALARPSPTPRSAASPKPSPTPSAKPSPSPYTTPSPRTSPVVAQQKSSPSPSTTSSTTQQPPVQGNTWNDLKQRARYWILLAQLNPVPVGIGVAVLLLLIGLLVLQRRRAKATRLVRARKSPKTIEPAVAAAKTASPAAAESAKPATETTAEDLKPAATGAAFAGATAAAAMLTSEPRSESPAADERRQRATRASEEVKKLMAGGDYDLDIIASEDRETRQLVGAELLSALVGRNLQRRERARNAFMKHGYFDDATRDLRIAESPNERAAAARRLSFVHDREATPHLIAALDDPSPDVRRAAVEALMDLRDPAAIAPLNSLMQTETDRKVPRSLMKHAIETCATSGSEESVTMPAASSLSYTAPTPTTRPAEIEREVIEI